jgi:hypothetical protein
MNNISKKLKQENLWKDETDYSILVRELPSEISCESVKKSEVKDLNGARQLFKASKGPNFEDYIIVQYTNDTKCLVVYYNGSPSEHHNDVFPIIMNKIRALGGSRRSRCRRELTSEVPRHESHSV